MIKTGILTVSDRGYHGAYRDLSGPAIHTLITEELAAMVEMNPSYLTSNSQSLER